MKNNTVIPFIKGTLKFTLFLLILSNLQSVFAQNATILDEKITITFKNDDIASALDKIKNAVDCNFSYESIQLKKEHSISKNYTNTTLREILNDILVEHQIYYAVRGNVILIRTDVEKKQVSGKIITPDGNPVAFVSVVLKSTNYGASTDENGDFNFYAPEGNYKIVVSSIGFKSEEKPITIVSDNVTQVNFTLSKTLENLEEIIVSAGRTSEKLSEVSSSISVLASKDIKQISQYSNVVSDLVAKIPGTNIQTNRQQTRGQYLRGRNMLILIDGVPQSSPLFVTGNINLLDPSAIERIEVVKGSTSIYGNGAEGGIINYITKKNTTANTFESNTTIGSSISLTEPSHTSGSSFSQFFNGRAGKWNYVLGGTYKQFGIKRDANGEILSPRDGLGETQWYNAFAKIGYEIGNGYDVGVMYNFFSNNQRTELSPVVGVYRESPSTGTFGLQGAESLTRGVKYNHNLKFTLSKKNIYKNTDLTASYYLQNFKTIYDSFAYFANVSQGLSAGQPGVTTKQSGLRFNLKTDYSFSNNFNGNLVYGLDLLRNKTAQPMKDGRVFAPEMDMKNYAVYFQTKAKYNDFIFRAGSRYEIINIAVDDYTTLFRNNGETTGGGIDINGGEQDYRAITFNFGLRYNVLNSIQPYANFSQSFSVGELGRILRTTEDSNIITNNIEDAKAVITNNFELGLEGNITDNIRYKGNYFISHSKLGTTYTEKSNGFFELARLPEKIYGFEFELGFSVNQKLDVDLSLATIEGKVDNNNNKDFNDAEDSYISGLRISPTIFRSSINYKVTSKWELNIASIISGKRDRFSENENGRYSFGQAPVESTFVTNIFTSYKLTKNTSLLVGIENLFNSDYYPIYSQHSGRAADYIKGDGINGKISLNIKL
ncbi:TonB-dependent receptor [Aquimarina sp. I32.4]|uniref:TonB-dependent receptor domain-containing protein n=1 Tax=Aquimarina sp. I32.4 TaxID=2053903 RepID=UPI000CDE7519|nr:TonB-dependent receptor [Aquimarina sp. I32.4]